ncbi:anosmin-1-like [Elysia marginata]|uniref:Anosmin-1-like n=1 Tax=Elysia marginata TaxID=1093978 RepID=A0AAV4JIA1_9GAST|nr:anosmin-1-like [Elysia marginata]
MRGLGIGLFLLWIIVHEGYCNYAEILWGQCHVFCLTGYQSKKLKEADLTNVPLNRDSAINGCRKDRECKWCLSACQRPKKDYGDHEGCMKSCRNPKTKRNRVGRNACFGGCRFISKALESKHGICPPPAELPKLQGSCDNKCEKDVTCSGMSKCCNSTCGRICHSLNNQDEFPEKPEKIRFKERNDGNLLVQWNKSRSPDFSAPVVYILRWWCPYTSGVRYSVTTKLRSRLKGYPDGVHPAIRCNYMLASINIHGSQGFTSPIGHLKKFLHPSPPQNLERTTIKLHDGKVDMTIQWQPPEFTDGVDVDRYVVFWSDGLPRLGKSYMRLPINRKIVRSGKTTYTIPSLEPGIMYFVQVRAIVDWRGKSIRGKPASTYMESFSTPLPPEDDVEQLREEFLSESRVYDIMVDEPMFVDSKLKARASWSLSSKSAVEKYILYWTLDVCEGEAKHRKTPSRLKQEATTYKQEYHLFGLESGCVYELKIHTVNFFGDQGKGQKQFFRTPPCHKTKGRSPDILCKSEVSTPLPPQSVEVSFLPTCSCQAVVSWLRPDMASNQVSSNSAKAFLVKWGQSRPLPAATRDVKSLAVVYNAEPYSVSVSGNLSKACMNYLKPGAHYTVQVATLSDGGKSPPVIKHFTTPVGTMPCFSFDDGNMQSDQSSPAGAKTAVAEKSDIKSVKQEVTQSSTYGRSSAVSSLHKAGSVILCSLIFILRCAVN